MINNNIQQKSIKLNGKEVSYGFEQKDVKNLNLRIRNDSSIYVSANSNVPEEVIENFILSKSDFITRRLKHLEELQYYKPNQKKYVSGETFNILGHSVRLQISEGEKISVYTDGIYLYAQVKDINNDFSRKKVVEKYLSSLRKEIFTEILYNEFKRVEKYGVKRPELRIRNMETRWGTCVAHKGMITLNNRLLETQKSCIEYVVVHELCHLIHPNHSKDFYNFLTMLMPDWKIRKEQLDKYALYWL